MLPSKARDAVLMPRVLSKRNSESPETGGISRSQKDALPGL